VTLRSIADVARAWLAVRRAQATKQDRPLGELVGRDPNVLADGRHPLDARVRGQGERWGLAVDRALRLVPGDRSCLIRATALRDLLVMDGLAKATVRIGVRRDQRGFTAHAWVELDGTPIAELSGGQGEFTPLEGVTLR
jgi:hypothetical protein